MPKPTNYYLSIRRDGMWEASIQSPDNAYLADTANKWLNLEMIKGYRISSSGYKTGKVHDDGM